MVAKLSDVVEPETEQRYQSTMDPRVIMGIRSLDLRARIVVEGFRTGLNRSPRHGFSVEFSEYRHTRRVTILGFSTGSSTHARTAATSGCSKTKRIFAVM